MTAKSIEGEITSTGRRGKHHRELGERGHQDHRLQRRDHGRDDQRRHHARRAWRRQSVEVATVNGDVTYDGTLARRGRYRFNTHNGDIRMTVPETSNATFSVRTYNGDFTSNLPLNGRQAVRGRQRAPRDLHARERARRSRARIVRRRRQDSSSGDGDGNEARRPVRRGGVRHPSSARYCLQVLRAFRQRAWIGESTRSPPGRRGA